MLSWSSRMRVRRSFQAILLLTPLLSLPAFADPFFKLPKMGLDREALVQVARNLLRWAPRFNKIAAGGRHTCAIKNGGTVWCWGMNSIGQLGYEVDERDQISRTPRQVEGMDHVVDLVAGLYHTCALKEDRRVFCWGMNSERGAVPSEVRALRGANIIEMAAGGLHTCACKEDGTVWCWGNNTYGQLGSNAPDPSRDAVQVQQRGLANVTAIATGEGHTCALSGETIRCWGLNDHHEAPPRVEGLGDIVSIAAGGWHTCALTAGGTVSCWGENQSGQLGDGTTTDRENPVAVAGLNEVSSIAVGGGQTCAIKRDGSLWCWGSNEHHQLGYETPEVPADRPDLAMATRPGQVELRGVTSVTLGTGHTFALLEGGSAFYWGWNADGQLGDGRRTDVSAPTFFWRSLNP